MLRTGLQQAAGSGSLLLSSTVTALNPLVSQLARGALVAARPQRLLRTSTAPAGGAGLVPILRALGLSNLEQPTADGGHASPKFRDPPAKFGAGYQ